MYRHTERQHGLVTYEQLLATGLTDRQIEHRVQSGQLIRVHREIYRLAGVEPTYRQAVLAACLASKGHAAGLTAARLFGIVSGAPPLEVAITTSRRVTLRDAAVRRLDMRAEDTTRRHGIPLTSAPRTLVDIAGVLEPSELQRTIDRAFREHLVTPERLLNYASQPRFNRFKNIDRVRTTARDRWENGVPESELEFDLIELAERFSIPPPDRQVWAVVKGRRVRFDLAYTDPLLVIEVDGRGPHWGKDAWQSDHDRDNAIELADIPKLAFTWDDVHERPYYVVFTIAEKRGLIPSRWRAGKAPTYGRIRR